MASKASAIDIERVRDALVAMGIDPTSLTGGGGAEKFLTKTIQASGAALDVALPGGFPRYKIRCRVSGASAASDVEIITSADGVAFDEGASDYTSTQTRQGTALATSAVTSAAFVEVVDAFNLQASNLVGCEIVLDIEHVGSASHEPLIAFRANGRESANVRSVLNWGTCRRKSQAPIVAIRFRPASGTFTAVADLYGVKDSIG